MHTYSSNKPHVKCILRISYPPPFFSTSLFLVVQTDWSWCIKIRDNYVPFCRVLSKGQRCVITKRSILPMIQRYVCGMEHTLVDYSCNSTRSKIRWLTRSPRHPSEFDIRRRSVT